MLLDDVATYLAAQSTALSIRSGTTGNMVKAARLEAGLPDTVVALYEQTGSPNGYSFSTGVSATVDYESPTLQIVVRSSAYTNARSLIQTAYTVLDGLGESTLPTATGTRYLSVMAAQAPFSIGRDANDRYLLSVNFAVSKEVG